MIRRIIECSPLLRDLAKITESKITFPELNATITAIPSNFAGAAGGNQNIVVFDESWAYTSERSRRLWDEMVPPPTRKIGVRLTTTYAGFTGESTLLEELYARGMQQPEIASRPARWRRASVLLEPHADSALANRKLARGDAPQPAPERLLADDREQVRRQRVELHRLSVLGRLRRSGRDAGPRRSPPFNLGRRRRLGQARQTAIVAVTWDDDKPRLVAHRVFQPRPDDPIDFESTVERTLLDFNKRFCIQKVLFDPYMLHPVMQRLSREGIDVEEFPQTTGNLTDASQNLFEVIRGRNIVVYPAADIRLAISRAIAIETSRGWRIAKDRQSHKIDVVVALAMAALACVRAQSKSSYDTSMRWAV